MNEDFKPDNVHAEHEDREHTLCGRMQTRNDPVTDDFDSVNCLECVLILQARKDIL